MEIIYRVFTKREKYHAKVYKNEMKIGGEEQGEVT